MKKLLILTLFLLGVAINAVAQVPTPNPANGTSVCINSTVVYGPATITTGVAYSFTILPAVPFTSISTGTQISVLWATAGIYTITLSDNDPCTSNTVATITVNTVGVINGPDIIVCQNTGTYPIVSNTAGAAFTIAGLPVASINSNILAPGSYVINATFTDANGCVSIGTINVTITPTVPMPLINSN